MNYYILDKNRQAVKVDAETHLHWRKSDDRFRRVGETEIGTVRVSTVFLGVDHNWFGGEPHIFETMCFDSNGSELDLECERYATWADAEIGHTKMVEKVKRFING